MDSDTEPVEGGQNGSNVLRLRGEQQRFGLTGDVWERTV